MQSRVFTRCETPQNDKAAICRIFAPLPGGAKERKHKKQGATRQNYGENTTHFRYPVFVTYSSVVFAFSPCWDKNFLTRRMLKLSCLHVFDLSHFHPARLRHKRYNFPCGGAKRRKVEHTKIRQSHRLSFFQVFDHLSRQCENAKTRHIKSENSSSFLFCRDAS